MQEIFDYLFLIAQREPLCEKSGMNRYLVRLTVPLLVEADSESGAKSKACRVLRKGGLGASKAEVELYQKDLEEKKDA